jgi:hypothetical protein
MKDLIFSKHPWSVSPYGRYIRAEGVDGYNIAIIEDQPPYTNGNTRLIAAAPKMYETIVEIISELETGSYENMVNKINKAKKILAAI